MWGRKSFEIKHGEEKEEVKDLFREGRGEIQGKPSVIGLSSLFKPGVGI